MSEFSEKIANLSPKRLALLCMDLDEELRALKSSRNEPIAIIGMGCRFPGGVKSPEDFWQLLEHGFDPVTEVPSDRWDVDAFYDQDPDAIGKIYTRHGAFLEGIDQFDAAFFGIEPREASSMDPQQRLLLEVVWEALERAGQTKHGLAASRTGVFVGIGINDYATIQYKRNDPELISVHTGTGTGLCFAAGRLSHVLGLRGPSLAIDTACSSSLAAVHLACQSLRLRECNLALAAAVNLILSPEVSLFLSRSRALSRDGRCKAFDAQADGYGRGEGCGAIVLKRLSDAHADRDLVLAVIRGSAVNHDGPSSGLAVPSGAAQQAVIREALENAAVEPGEVSYIETHGTGTLLGDAIELQSLAAVFGSTRPAHDPIALGSVKTNVGHLEAAAGMAGLLKVVLALNRRALPPHLHLTKLNPHVSLAAIPAVIPTRLTSWEALRRVAGVSAFGLSGTNAHVIIQEAPVVEYIRPRFERPLHILTLSAQSLDALRALALAIENGLTQNSSVALPDLCFSANTGRSQFLHRLAVACSSRNDLRARLLEWVSCPNPPDSSVGSRPKISFAFAGLGPSLAGIARQLYETQPAFRRSLERCDNAIGDSLGISVVSHLCSDHGEYSGRHEQAMPDRFQSDVVAHVALQCALSELWRSWGIEPATVVGHGAGEYAAAFCAGVFGLEDALRLALERCASLLGTQGTGPERNATATSYSPPKVSFISTSLRVPMAAEAVSQLEYWLGLVLKPSEADAGLRARLRQIGPVILELGIETLLSQLEIERDSDGKLWLSSLKPGVSNWEQMLESLRALYVAGADIDWFGFDRDYSRRRVPLPTYPFRRSRYWLDRDVAQSGSVASAPDRIAATVPVASPGRAHPLLGLPMRSVTQEIHFDWEAPSWPEFVFDHRVCGAVVLPASAYIESALAAYRLAFDSACVAVEDVALRKPLIVAPQLIRALRLSLKVGETVGWRISSRACGEHPNENWIVHATGRLRAGTPDALSPAPRVDLEALRARCSEEIAVASFYEGFRVRGLDHGPSLQAVEQVWHGHGESLGRIALATGFDSEASNYEIHPALLDACFQVAAPALLEDPAYAGGTDSFVPVGIRRLRIHDRIGTRAWCHAALRTALTLDLNVYDEDARILLEISGFIVQRANREALLREDAEERNDGVYEIAWEERPRARRDLPMDTGRWLILSDRGALADRGGLAEELSRHFDSTGSRCVRVYPGPSYRMFHSGEFEVNLESPEDLRRLMASDEGGGPYRGVIHLLIDAESRPRDSAALETSCLRKCASVLHLIQAITALHSRVPPRLWIVTRGAQATGISAPTTPEAATLWGLGRTIALEQPSLWGGLIDLDLAGSRDEAALLVEEIIRSDGEDQVAYRAGRRLVCRLARSLPGVVATNSVPVRREASYVITGGLGGLGIEIARWLARSGAGQIVLLSRRNPLSLAGDLRAALASLETAGTKVRVLQADVTDTAQLTEAFRAIESAGPAVKGIIHAAGVAELRTIGEMNIEALRPVLRPKVVGTSLLAEQAQGLALDFFVLFSSFSSLWGAPELSHYAAANAFLDAFAYQQRASGIPMLAINWGPWAGVGMAKDFRFPGLEPLEPPSAIRYLEQLLGTRDTGRAVVLADWKMMKAAYEVRERFLERIETGSSATESAAPARDPEFVSRLRSVTPGERATVLSEAIADEVSRLVGAVAGNAITPGQGFFEMGLDSVAALELRRRLEKLLGRRLSATLVFDHPTIDMLAAFLAAEVCPEEVSRSSALSGRQELAGRAAMIERLSETETQALLAEQLKRIQDTGSR